MLTRRACVIQCYPQLMSSPTPHLPGGDRQKKSSQYPLAAATTRLVLAQVYLYDGFIYLTDVGACGNRTKHGSRSESLYTLKHPNVSVVGYTNQQKSKPPQTLYQDLAVIAGSQNTVKW